jgi:hypothetical protein
MIVTYVAIFCKGSRISIQKEATEGFLTVIPLRNVAVDSGYSMRRNDGEERRRL